LFMDPEKFLEANYLVTPVHIQPEWYFLAGYAVLRSVPNKMGGVIGLLMVFIIFYFKPFFRSFCSVKKIIFWFWIRVVLGLTWIGGCVVEFPFIEIGQVLTFLYFFIIVFFL
jgi:ubiquinol-cytochrome c reductase cytochrome b subunit